MYDWTIIFLTIIRHLDYFYFFYSCESCIPKSVVVQYVCTSLIASWGWTPSHGLTMVLHPPASREHAKFFFQGPLGVRRRKGSADMDQGKIISGHSSKRQGSQWWQVETPSLCVGASVEGPTSGILFPGILAFYVRHPPWITLSKRGISWENNGVAEVIKRKAYSQTLAGGGGGGGGAGLGLRGKKDQGVRWLWHCPHQVSALGPTNQARRAVSVRTWELPHIPHGAGIGGSQKKGMLFYGKREG